MNRGEIWTLQDTTYASKARPAIIVQDEHAGVFDSIILCLLTTFDSDGIPTRVLIEPSATNGLHKMSYAMTDKIVTVDKALLGEHIGTIATKDMELISAQIAKILGIRPGII